MNYLSLFSGIGGLDLGLDRAGMTCVGQVELDPFCRTVLDRHWPEVPKHDDVRTTPAWWASRSRPPVQLVAGGFPCQPFSRAGRRLGTGDPRWGWPWFADVVRAVRPRYVLVENVAALIADSRAFGWMLGDLAALGFDADWSVLSACAVGAPHVRRRLFLVAHTPHVGQACAGVAVPAQTETPPVAGTGTSPIPRWPGPVESRPPGVAYGVPRRMDRVKALGNAVVPQVAEQVGRMIMEHAA